MNIGDVWKADATRAFLAAKKVCPAVFRSALLSIPPYDRDVWVDHVFGLDAHAEDGPELPQGCAPYLPCPVDVIIAAIDEAAINSADVFVDIGSGVGRVALLVRLLTGAGVIGIEVQSSLFLIDVTECPDCGGRMKWMEACTEQRDINRVLAAHGLCPRAPPQAP